MRVADFTPLEKADKVKIRQPSVKVQIVRKKADQIVNNSATLQNDNELKLPALANEEWLVELYILSYSPSSTPDMKVQWSLPSGATGYQYGVCYNAAGTPTQYRSANDAALNVECSSYLVMRSVFWLVVLMGATSGNIQLQWAQNTATAENTTIKAGSFIKAIKVN